MLATDAVDSLPPCGAGIAACLPPLEKGSIGGPWPPSFRAKNADAKHRLCAEGGRVGIIFFVDGLASFDPHPSPPLFKGRGRTTRAAPYAIVPPCGAGLGRGTSVSDRISI